MILELVTFKTPAGWDRARVLEDAKHTIPKWSSNPDLRAQALRARHRR